MINFSEDKGEIEEISNSNMTDEDIWIKYLKEDEYLNSRGVLVCIRCCCRTLEQAIGDILKK